jgi:hypothetical protein
MRPWVVVQSTTVRQGTSEPAGWVTLNMSSDTPRFAAMNPVFAKMVFFVPEGAVR